ncbi:uncharacterized protein [Apostichopus japonicus]|uniref:uncharacterized protein n=1 Tax=Stichopus japonicus TaxID=307972 RepID=UPI003AB13127
MTKEKTTTLKDFLSSTTNLSDHHYLSLYHDTVLTLFESGINEWLWTYEAKSNDKEKEHQAKLQAIIEKVIKYTGGFVNPEKLSIKTKSQDQSLEDGETGKHAESRMVNFTKSLLELFWEVQENF